MLQLKQIIFIQWQYKGARSITKYVEYDTIQALIISLIIDELQNDYKK